MLIFGRGESDLPQQILEADLIRQASSNLVESAAIKAPTNNSSVPDSESYRMMEDLISFHLEAAKDAARKRIRFQEERRGGCLKALSEMFSGDR